MDIIKKALIRNKAERFNETELNHVIKNLDIETAYNGTVMNIIDPCLGMGESLNSIKSHLENKLEGSFPITTYGVEIDTDIANLSYENVDYFLNEDCVNIRSSNQFNLLLLNPMNSQSTDEKAGLRILRHLTNKSTNILSSNAVLIYSIPFYALRSSIPTLIDRFYNINVYRFSEGDDLVITAKFGRMDVQTRATEGHRLREIAGGELLNIPVVEAMDCTYSVPLSNTEVQLFRAGKLHPDEIKKDLAESSALLEFEKQITIKEERDEMKSPILPLKPTHAGVAIASGAVGGNLGTHIVTGLTKQKKVVSNIEDSQGVINKERHSLFYTSVVRVFSQDGIFELE